MHLLPAIHLLFCIDFKTLYFFHFFFSLSPYWPHLSTQTHLKEHCGEQTLPLVVQGATREIVLQWSHKSHRCLGAANQWEHQDLYPALRKSRASIRQTNHAAGIYVMKSTSAWGSEMVSVNHTPLVGCAVHPISLYSLLSCSLLQCLNI